MASTQAKINFQITPIILTGGIAAQISGGQLPLINLLNIGTTSSTEVTTLPGDLDEAFGAFNVLPGGTLVTQSIGKYPFANQDVAANAVIREPITISVIMDAPMRPLNHMENIDVWAIKMTAFTALKEALERHNNSGGLYTIATPAYVYTNCIMLNMTDNSRGSNSLPQNAWRFDFERPLVALVELDLSYNSLMGKINAQVQPTTVAPSGVQVGLMGSNPTLARTIKATGGLAGAASVGVSDVTPTLMRSNYPVMPNPSSFPYSGIS
jgi:hypothetical protein